MSLKALFVDDDYSVNRYHEIILSKIDDAILQKNFFQDPRKAIVYLEGLEKENYPDFIFLDLNMPFLDGWAFLDKYIEKKLPPTKVIILTTSENPMHKQKAKEYELVYSYQLKPLDVEKVENYIKEIQP